MINVTHLTKTYGDRAAVDDISFEVKKGEILGFLGQNGAGKSTTMKILTGFMAATSGDVSVAGFNVFEHPIEVKRRIGFLPEVPPLYEELLVSEYLQFISELRSVPKHERNPKIDAAIEQCQLGDVRKRLIGNLSKGYRQRVGIAQAILHDPEVLVLDEPTIGLDPKQMSEARALIKSFHNNRTVIYSSHILSEVAATCDRIVVIDQGKIVAQENLAQEAIGGNLKTEIMVRKGGEGLVGKLKKVNGVTNVRNLSNGTNRLVVESSSGDELLAELSKVVVEDGAGLLRISPMQHALEEYYLDLIKGKRGVA